MRGLVLEFDKEGMLVKYGTCNVNVEESKAGLKTYRFMMYGIQRIYEGELNRFLNVDYDDISKMMFCIIK